MADEDRPEIRRNDSDWFRILSETGLDKMSYDDRRKFPNYIEWIKGQIRDQAENAVLTKEEKKAYATRMRLRVTILGITVSIVAVFATIFGSVIANRVFPVTQPAPIVIHDNGPATPFPAPTVTP